MAGFHLLYLYPRGHDDGSRYKACICRSDVIVAASGRRQSCDEKSYGEKGRENILNFSEFDWDMSDTLSEIKQFVVESADQVLEEHRQEILRAWKAVCFAEQTAELEGVLALESYLHEIKRMKPPCYEFLGKILLMNIDAVAEHLILEIITNQIYINKNEPYLVFVLYLYIVCCRDLVEVRHESSIRFMPEIIKEKIENRQRR